MLSRVSAALVKFLSPVSVSAHATRDAPLPRELPHRQKGGEKQPKKDPKKDQNQGGFQRFTPDEPEKVHSSAVGSAVAATDERSADSDVSDAKAKSVAQKPPAELGHNLTQLIFSFNGQKNLMKKWLGTQVYPHAAEEQKASGKIKKGIILDRKS